MVAHARGYPRRCVESLMKMCNDPTSGYLGEWQCNYCTTNGIMTYYKEICSGWTNLFSHCNIHPGWEIIVDPQTEFVYEVRNYSYA
jgi:hypothetical protein